MLRQRINDDLPYLMEFRHDLHMNPELMYEEIRTSQRVREELDKVGVSYVGDLAGGTGIVAWLPGAGGHTVALRADMDALPIQEETELPYASQAAGKMHACGHDGHTTVLVGAVRALAAEERANNILFVFQPAEEGGAGADRLVKEGALEGKVIGKPVDVMAVHGSLREANPAIPGDVTSGRKQAAR